MRTPGRCNKAVSFLQAIAPPAAVALVLLIYQSLYAFSFFPITEGWFSAYGSLIRSGAVPYRDFSLLLTPLYPLQVAAVQTVFGEGLIVARLFGILVTCAIGVTLWAVLARFFSRWICAFAASIATIYYQSGVAYIGYDFTQVLTLYLEIGALLMIVDVERLNKRDIRWLQASPIFFSGLFFAAATLTKQSNGGLAALVCGAAYSLVVLRTCQTSEALRRLAHFCVGGLVAWLPVLIWLGLAGALPSFFQQVVFDAMAAKGGGKQILSAWILGFLGAALHRQVAKDILLWTVGPGLVMALYYLSQKRILAWASVRNWRLPALAPIVMNTIGPIALVAIVIATWLSGSLLVMSWRNFATTIFDHVIPYSLVLHFGGFILALVLVLTKPSTSRNSVFMLLAFCLGLTIGNGTSAGLSEISAFMALAIGIAFLMTITAPMVLPSVVPLGLSLLLSALLIESKFEMPYAWWSVRTQDVRHKKCAQTDGILAGLCVDTEKYERIIGVVSTITSSTDPADHLYVFPHMPIFNMLSGRPPYRHAVVSWFDFMSASQANELIRSLSMDPPKVMLVARLPNEVFEAHERLFNAGHPSVQRGIIAAVDSLVAARKIRMIQDVEVDGMKMEIFLRSEPSRSYSAQY